MLDFTAIDFETANQSRDSACAVALVRVCQGAVVDRFSALIQPPPGEFMFTYVHGITRKDVRKAKTFAELWPQIQRFCDPAPLLVAHNATFDRAVLMACCAYYGIEPINYPFVCTVRAARSAWPALPRHSLDIVSQFLNIRLNHHEASSDAEACAHILIRATAAGFSPDQPANRSASRSRRQVAPQAI
jgi:DNA polymerase-3 subunit epsilon